MILRLRSLVLSFALTALIALSALAAGAAGAEEVFWSGARSLPVYSVEREDNALAITFDCAWGTEHTDAILKALEEANVKATFFTVQFWAEEHPDYLKKIDEAGHEIGTHSATHPKMSQLSEEAIKTELTTSSRAITEATGKQVTLFRPPFGDYDNAVIDTSLSLGLMPVQWDVDSLDWKDLSAKEIAERVVMKAKSGSIILCHNNGLHTAEALPVILDTLRARGFTFVPVGELIYRENYTIDHTGRQFSAAKG